MVLPLLLIMVLPKLMNAADPEAQKVICFALLKGIICLLHLLPYIKVGQRSFS